MPPQNSNPSSERPTGALLLVLAAVQFVHVLDFVIVMPLGPQLMRMMELGPHGFGLLISAYNLAAAFAGLLGAFFLDRFDRKRALLVVLGGLILSTLSCGLASGNSGLLLGRVFAGAFGGLVQALLFAIVGDCFPERQRGSATGTVMSAFSVASVIGVPIGLSLAHGFGWRATFAVLSVLGLFAWIAASLVLPKLRSHLSRAPDSAGAKSLLASDLRSTFQMFSEKNSMIAFVLITSLMFAGFTVIPFMSAYLVSNVGLSEADLASIFLAGGLATFMTSRLAGKLSDRFGKIRVFTWLAGFSIFPILLLTHLSRVELPWAIVITTLFTVAISARAVPALAMITSSIEKKRRGRFLSLTSAVQQATSGLASLAAGEVLIQDPSGLLMRYDWIGNFAAVATLCAIFAARRLRRRS